MSTIAILPVNIKEITQPLGLVAGPSLEAIIVDPNGPVPTAAALNAVVGTINQAITSLAAANNPAIPSTALAPPVNFHFFDGTVQVGGEIPGDAFKGTTPGINSQFLDLTPDNVGITGLTPNFLAATFTGSDLLAAAAGGRNIMAGGSGTDTYVGGTGVGSVDTFLADVSGGKTDATIFNFHSGDDAALIGVRPADFALSFADSVQGLVLTASPVTPNHNGATLTLAGFTTADIGGKLSFGVDNSASTPYVFVHGN